MIIYGGHMCLYRWIDTIGWRCVTCGNVCESLITPSHVTDLTCHM